MSKNLVRVLPSPTHPMHRCECRVGDSSSSMLSMQLTAKELTLTKSTLIFINTGIIKSDKILIKFQIMIQSKIQRL